MYYKPMRWCMFFNNFGRCDNNNGWYDTDDNLEFEGAKEEKFEKPGKDDDCFDKDKGHKKDEFCCWLKVLCCEPCRKPCPPKPCPKPCPPKPCCPPKPPCRPCCCPPQPKCCECCCKCRWF